MKSFKPFRVFIGITLVLVSCSVITGFFLLCEDKNSPSQKPHELILYSNWYPLPIMKIEKNRAKPNYKYWVVLENGLGFYSNDEYSMGDTIAWINDLDSVVFTNPYGN